MTDFKIPVDSMVAQFGDHLKAYPRTILSARFGDGKSYFLDAVKRDETLGKDFAFLTIYPINYQVMGNEDIFDLIKYDILYQLLLNDLIIPNFEISETEKVMWYMKYHTGDILSIFLPRIVQLGLESMGMGSAMFAILSSKLYKNLRDGYKKFNDASMDQQIEEYMKIVESNKLYECDLITRTIQCSIEAHKEKCGKKIVLIIEDMDRMDPAHMFRILNILSAHIDYGYRSLPIEPMLLDKNKFGFDNIVIALDYENLKRIFKHFYGDSTSFDGYISKFLSGNYFQYSLKAVKKEYILGKINELTSLPKDIIQRIFTDKDLEDNSLREVVQSFDIFLQIPNKPRGVYGKTSFDINLSLLKLMAVMKRLKICSNEIVGKILEWPKDLGEDSLGTFYCYVGPFMFEEGYVEKTKKQRPQIYAKKQGYTVLIIYDINVDDGLLKIKSIREPGLDVDETDFHDCVEHMLEFIV